MSAPAPRRIAAFTTFHAEGYHAYGRRMLEAFDRHWPRDITVYAYYEGARPAPVGDRVEVRDLLACSPGLAAFKQRHRGNDAAHGREDRGPMPFDARAALGKLLSLPGRLRGRAARSGGALRKQPKRQGIGYRWDAVRFAHKTYCIFHAADTIDADALLWIDADTLTFRDVPRAFVESTLPETAMLSFLGRPYRTSECGYVGYNLRHPDLRDFLACWRELYDTDALFDLAEWHDSWVFDWVRRRFEARGTRTHDLSACLGRRAVAHPFINGPLGAYMDHLKGERKEHGRSPATDLVVDRGEAYWRAATGRS
jgi:hypothetical protein